MQNAEKILEIKYNQKIAKMLISLNYIDDNIKNAIALNIISFKIALSLNKLKKIDAIAILDVFKKLFLSFSRQKEFISLIKDISKIEDLEIIDFLKSKEILTVLSSDIDTKEKSKKIQNFLYVNRYPSIASAKKNFAKNINIPQTFKLKSPENFEGLDYELAFKFRNKNDLKKRSKELEKISKNPNWGKFAF